MVACGSTVTLQDKKHNDHTLDEDQHLEITVTLMCSLFPVTTNASTE